MDSFQGGLLSKSASAYEHFRRLATRGLLRPDRRLSPTDLASDLRISVTPVRDALVRLAAEGFIRGQDGRGYFTKAYTVAEQHDLLQLLFTLVVAALESARVRGRELTQGAMEELERALQVSEAQSPDLAAGQFTDAMDELLLEIAAASGNSVLPAAVRNILDRTRHIRQIDSGKASQRVAKATVMRALLAAMASGNLPGAIVLMRNHLLQFEERLPATVEEANRGAAQLKYP